MLYNVAIKQNIKQHYFDKAFIFGLFRHWKPGETFQGHFQQKQRNIYDTFLNHG